MIHPTEEELKKVIKEVFDKNIIDLPIAYVVDSKTGKWVNFYESEQGRQALFKAFEQHSKTEFKTMRNGKIIYNP